ncbi:alkaline phosphatase family protein [Pseudorhodoferax sp.]|uniref:alkaline phosphatase family protein n=1 Tax=Pseudorhodoferax sp. TaxID=1993553 RepID=UPI002DD61D58|nr:alkaline phosphatase family protein [Pseudorhodoferax sp.]
MISTPNLVFATTLGRRAALACAACLLVACAAPTPPAPAVPPPRLVVFIAIDGLPQRQVTAYRDQLAPDGFARFLERGSWFSDAHYGHGFTVTAAGHATMLTGAYPHRTGIIGNDWRVRETGELMYCTGDARHQYIGNPTKQLDGTSPANLKAETVGDMLRRADPRAKVIAISGKDRGAILPAGQRGTAYMYMGQSGQFASSTFYMPAHPAWVDAFNAEKRADRYFKKAWTPLLPDAAYARSLPDGQPWYAKGGQLPAVMGEAQDKPDGAYYAGLLRSPFVDAMSLEFARAAIAGEGLGQDDVPDILSISLSGHDYVNHAFSAESRLSHDHMLQLDRLLEAFFKDLDARVGRDRYVVVLTADHGFMPAPEYSKSQGHASGRMSGSQALARINTGLEQRFGAPKLAQFFSASALMLDRQLIASRGLDPAAVQEEARRLLLQEEGVEVAYTRVELEGGQRAGAPHFVAMLRAWYSERSGDVQYALKPYWMMTSSSAVTTHGSVHGYDTHVPILVWGPAWAGAGEVRQRVEVVDIAPTLARWLGVPPPPLAEGKALPVVRR